MKHIVAEFISDDPGEPAPRGERLFLTGWEDVVFRLDDAPAPHSSAPLPRGGFPVEGDDPFAPFPEAENQ